jgi:HEAT repeat protein
MQWDSPAFGRSCAALGRMGVVAIPALVKLLRDGDHDVYGAIGATNALRGMEPKPVAAIPALIEALSSKHVNLRMSAAMALRYMGPVAKAAIATLMQRLEDPDGTTRGQVRIALKGIRGEQ